MKSRISFYKKHVAKHITTKRCYPLVFYRGLNLLLKDLMKLEKHAEDVVKMHEKFVACAKADGEPVYLITETKKISKAIDNLAAALRNLKEV